MKSVIVDNYKYKTREDSLTKFDKASKLLFESLSIYRKLDYKEGIGICLRNLGILYSKKDSLYKAMLFLEEALDMNRRTGSLVAENGTLKEIGKLHIATLNKNQSLEEFEKGISAYKKALMLKGTEKTSVLLHLGLAYHTAFFYFSSEKAPEGIIDSASYYYQLGMDAAVDENNLKDLSYIINNYAGICKALPPESDCKAILRKAQDVYSRLNSSSKKSQLEADRIYNRYLMNKQTLSAINELNELKLKQSLVVGAILLMLITSFILLYDRLRIRFLKRQLASKQIALQSQMNPHFISNSLNAIESLINLNENRMASSYLVKFSHLARMILQHSQAKSIPLADEVKMLKDYLELEKLRMTDKLNFHIQIDSELDIYRVGIPPMMIQPLVENAVWHGIKLKNDPGNITISFQKEAENLLMCIVEDNGVGRALSKELQGQSAFPRISHSTRIIEERIDVLKSQKGADLRITDLIDEKGNPAGTKAEMFMNFTDLLTDNYENT